MIIRKQVLNEVVGIGQLHNCVKVVEGHINGISFEITQKVAIGANKTVVLMLPIAFIVPNEELFIIVNAARSLKINIKPRYCNEDIVGLTLENISDDLVILEADSFLCDCASIITVPISIEQEPINAPKELKNKPKKGK